MKILYVDFNTTGHHLVYFREIMKINDINSVLVLPQITEKIAVKQYEIPQLSRNMSFSQYCVFLKALNNIINAENPSFVHILSGDMLYRFFGYRLGSIKCPVVITFHHMEFLWFKRISYRFICLQIRYGIVHTEYIYNQLTQMNIHNIFHIEYPYLEEVKKYDISVFKKNFGISMNEKVFLAFGETRYDKGLDILLKAFSCIKEAFYLIIAGKATDITECEIDKLTKKYQNRVIKILNFIDDDLMYQLFAMSDIVVLPYRKKFAGASGPLTTAVAYEKMIIGSNINSIGSIIRNNHLGYLFECEDYESLRFTIEKAIAADFIYDEKAKKYQEAISKKLFLNNYRRLYVKIGLEV